MWGAARILALLRHERTIREALEQATNTGSRDFLWSGGRRRMSRASRYLDPPSKKKAEADQDTEPSRDSRD